MVRFIVLAFQVFVLVMGALLLAKIALRLVPSSGALPSQQAIALRDTLLAYANKSVSPCDDFYEHVCGGWLSRQDPLNDEASTDVIELRIDDELQKLATAGWPLLQTWYDTCMDARARNVQSLAPLYDLIDATNDTATLVGSLHRLGFSAFFTPVIAASPNDSTVRQLYFDWAESVVPLEVLQAANSSDKLAYKAWARKALAPALQSAQLEAAFAIEESQLVPLMTDVDYAPLANSDWNWQNYWAAFMPATEVLAISAKYMSGAIRLATKSNDMTSVRLYLKMRVAAGVLDALPSQPISPGACLQNLKTWLAPVLGHYYASLYASPADRAAAQLMLTNLLAGFHAQLEQTTWMDQATKDAALRKLAAIQPMIGYPDHWSSVVPPDAVHLGDHIGNELRVLAAWAQKQSADFCLPVDRYAWQMQPYEVNAYYDPSENMIVFPSGIIQAPFFNATAPLAANYGGLGSVIGHEIGHAFDDTGRLYGPDGNEQDWWSAQSEQAFEKKAQCVVGLYDGLPIDTGIVVNGELTLGENWADISGLDAAYTAFTMARLPFGLEKAQVERVFGFSDDQLFFRVWALGWCSHVVRSEEYERAMDDPHAPAKWRVNVPASQSAAFRKAFRCKAPKVDCDLS